MPPPFIVMKRLAVANWVGLLESATCTVKLNVPVDPEGVPEIAPLVLIERPVGSDPLIRANE